VQHDAGVERLEGEPVARAERSGELRRREAHRLDADRSVLQQNGGAVRRALGEVLGTTSTSTSLQTLKSPRATDPTTTAAMTGKRCRMRSV
jgi:hypothetical protein